MKVVPKVTTHPLILLSDNGKSHSGTHWGLRIVFVIDSSRNPVFGTFSKPDESVYTSWSSILKRIEHSSNVDRKNENV